MSKGKALIGVGKTMTVALLVTVMVGCVSRGSEHEGKIALIDSLNLTAAERQMLEQRAAKGDAAAASSLGNFYALVLCDDAVALRWYKRAAALGGKQERETYESFVSTLHDDE
ncbi:hypothetical protein DES53_102188 [Roseimicrobium gellanilyticum]|uniref:Sel1 repeat-containing protein n=1 Tax=Roseimicrobium gellanilyticum TaxID=748857 RepID=A0A366HQQ6_9BACT|nr:hypothetical protein [Roseimicrobium gellanilyticum]RBP45806.1 hypothetical protein DES53_102188 [Roseimicrobium gellanilyticum]